MKDIIVVCYSIIFLCGCNGTIIESPPPEKSQDSLLMNFNAFFKTITADENFEDFTEMYNRKPIFQPHFYEDYELNGFYFFEFYNEDNESQIVINRDSLLPYHEIYTCNYFEPYYYIDFSSNIHANLNFLNEYGYKIFEAKGKLNDINSTENIFDKRLIQKWNIDSCTNGEIRGMLSINFKEDSLFIDGKEIMYTKLGNQISSSQDSTVNLKIIGLSNRKLVVSKKIKGDEIAYYYTAIRF